MIMESMKLTSDRPPGLSDQGPSARERQCGMAGVTDKSMPLGRFADEQSAPDFDGRYCQVSDISELMRHILRLQPHEELDMIVDSAGSPAVSEDASHNGHRGYLMDIELGEVSSICVKRTF